MSGTEIHESKKRKRIHGTFVCEHPGCDKVFTRIDRLTRHKKNHDPTKRHICEWPGCGRDFVRNDVKEKHYKKHLTNTLNNHDLNFIPADLGVNKSGEESFPINNSNLLNSIEDSIVPTKNNQEVPALKLSPADLIEWLFHEDTFNGDRLYQSNEYANFPGGYSPVSFTESVLAAPSPQFPFIYDNRNFDDTIREKLIRMIPSLDQNPDFETSKIDKYFQTYWLVYHPQYPILHRPTFSYYKAEPLLLLAIIVLGSSLIKCTGFVEIYSFNNTQKLAEEIAGPLRWLIFSSTDCRPPAKLYIIQSLLLLESFEITSTSRFLHERSFLYHGTKIQLLRRSPILGGDPLNKGNEDNHPRLWEQWIEFESMKRASFMAFYLDTVNAAVYGHTLILYAHQIKLNLPCNEELWEFDNQQLLNESTLRLKNPKFLDTLKRLLNRERIEISAFSKKILLAGLLTIMFQMQQKDLQLSFLEWDSMKEPWKETISLAIDVWRYQMCPKGCCDTQLALSTKPGAEEMLPPMLKKEDLRCKFSLYHIAQISMRISHYDYIIYAGAPSRMNVLVSSSEYKAVSERVTAWAKSVSGGTGVVHAYLFLFEMFLSSTNEDITYRYNPNHDPFLHRKNIIASALLVIFAYNFSTQGPENDIYEVGKSIEYYPEKEDGYSYLQRIRKTFLKEDKIHLSEYEDSYYIHNTIKKYSNIVAFIPGRNNMVGLLKLFYNSYRNSEWEIGYEYSKLFRNCIERCLGKQSIQCMDMYSNDAF